MNTTDKNTASSDHEQSDISEETVSTDDSINTTENSAITEKSSSTEGDDVELVPTFTKKYVDPVANTVLTMLAVFGVAAIALWVYRAITGAMLVVFVSGSMEPTVETGALAYSTPIAHEDIAVGDVLTVSRVDEDMPISHRVVSVNDPDAVSNAIEQEYEYHQGGPDWLHRLTAGFAGSDETTGYPLTEEAVEEGEVSVLVMRGDANDVDDPRYYMVTDDNAVKYQFDVANAGYVIAWLGSNIILVFGLLIAVLSYFLFPFKSYKPKPKPKKP